VHAVDGSTLTFTVFALGEVDVGARLTIDTLVTAFFARGREMVVSGS
jgi:hypothetical protein